MGTRTSGAEGGGEQTTARKRGMAARLRPYIDDRPDHPAQRQALALGRHAPRWTAAGMLEAESRSARSIGYRGLANLAIAIEHDLLRLRHAAHTTTQEAATAALTV